MFDFSSFANDMMPLVQLGSLIYGDRRNKKALGQQQAVQEAEMQRQRELLRMEQEKEEKYAAMRESAANEKKRQYDEYSGIKQKAGQERNQALKALLNEYTGEGGKLKPHMEEAEQFVNSPQDYFAKIGDLMRQSPYGEKAQRSNVDMDRMGGDRSTLQGADWSDNARRGASTKIWGDALLGFNDVYNNKQSQSINTLLGELKNREATEINNPYAEKVEGAFDKYASNADYLADLTGIQGNSLDRNRELEGRYNTSPDIASLSDLIGKKVGQKNDFTNKLFNWITQESGANADKDTAKAEIMKAMFSNDPETKEMLGSDFDFSKFFPKKNYLLKNMLDGKWFDNLRNRGMNNETNNYNFGST